MADVCSVIVSIPKVSVAIIRQNSWQRTATHTPTPCNNGFLNNKIFNIYIYWLVCLFICIQLMSTTKHGNKAYPNLLCGNSLEKGRFKWTVKIEKLCLEKMENPASGRGKPENFFTLNKILKIAACKLTQWIKQLKDRLVKRNGRFAEKKSYHSDKNGCHVLVA